MEKRIMQYRDHVTNQWVDAKWNGFQWVIPANAPIRYLVVYTNSSPQQFGSFSGSTKLYTIEKELNDFEFNFDNADFEALDEEKVTESLSSIYADTIVAEHENPEVYRNGI